MRPLMGSACGLKLEPPDRIVVIGLTTPLCCWPFPQLCGFPVPVEGLRPRGVTGRAPAAWASLQSISSADPSRLPQQPAPLMDFMLPSAQVRFEGPPCRQGSTPVYVPPSGFGYPLGGFLPSNPSGLCFTPTALMGFSPSKPHHPARCRSVPTVTHPLAVYLAFDTSVFRPCTATQAAASGFLPSREVLVVNQPAPMGFSFLGYCRTLTLIFPSDDLLSCALPERLLTQHSRTHFRVSIDQRLMAGLARRNELVPTTTLLRFAHASVPQH
jgi:hypothetical protein